MRSPALLLLPAGFSAGATAAAADSFTPVLMRSVAAQTAHFTPQRRFEQPSLDLHIVDWLEDR